MKLAELQKNLGYEFNDESLLTLALTLPSANKGRNNQLMEFFGDAILEFIVSEKIYSVGTSEGELTERRQQLVSDSALTPVSQKLGLPEYFIKSKGDTVLKKSVPSAYEAVLAAIYLDGGMEVARSFVNRTLVFEPSSPQINYKGELQEYLQGKGFPLPEYIKQDIGFPQKPRFRSSVKIYDEIFSGEGESVKSAEQSAAKSALEYLKNNQL